MPPLLSSNGTPDLGLYVHVPFCARHCDFCAFYQEPPKRGDIERYLDGVECELARLCLGRRVDTVFWGGGTPGLLPPPDLERLGRAVLAAGNVAPSEWTVEMAPSMVRPERLAVLRDLGVTRISMGVQSFDEDLLRELGRLHTSEQVYRAIDAVRASGIGNLNLDLIFALPGQTLERWHKDLDRALALAPDHISTYCLTFEDDTALWARLVRGQVRRHSEAEEAAFYETTWDRLDAAGLRQYEVSNFARPGRECRHNIATWRMQEWVGVGPSASSQFAGRRHTNVPSLDGWLAGLDAGRPARVDVVDLSDALLAVDALVFGLRMNAGVDVAELRARIPSFDWNAVDRVARELSAEDLAALEGTRLRLTRRGRLLADQVAVHIMEALETAQESPGGALGMMPGAGA